MTLRILHVISRLNVGGAALHVLELAAEQRRRGHHVLVVAGRLPEGEESMEYVADELGVPVRHLPHLQRELSPRADAAAIRELVRIIQAERPDVLHTHAAKAGATGRIAALTTRDVKPRARVHTYHGHVLRGYFGRGREAAFRAVEHLLGRTSSALVAVSPEVRDDLVALRVAPRERFEVIPYGFDLSRRVWSDEERRVRLRTDLRLADDTFVVGWIGRFTAIKRPLDLIRGLRNLLDLGVDAALVAVGDGPDRPAAEELARELGVFDRCHFVGYQKEISDWYAAFDAFCLTSANEGTPVSAIEALAAERPVVATRVGGTPAVVEDGKSGFLVAPGDTATLARRLADLANDAETRRRLGEHGARRMRELYASERMADDVDALYQRILAR